MSKTTARGLSEGELIRLIGEGQTHLFEVLIADHVPKVYVKERLRGFLRTRIGKPRDT